MHYLTMDTADEDIWRILSENVPKEHHLHIHCFTDSPELAQKLFDHYPNCWIGITGKYLDGTRYVPYTYHSVTGVVTYSSNLNTSAVIRNLAASSSERNSSVLRLLLETDSPYMTPTNLPVSEMGIKSARSLATSHSAMIPYTAQFVAETAGNGWTTEEVLRCCRENARKMYGV
jgi:TatD DNase family protein